MNFDLNPLIRKNIRELKPYSSARLEHPSGRAVFLDANENPFNAPLNRYPDPLHRELRRKIAEELQVASEMIFTGNGSDEAIDLLYRATCDPGIHNVVGIDPTYGMYRVAAAVHGTEYREVPLNDDFSLQPGRVLEKTDPKTRLIFLCSPNNPTGNLLSRDAMRELIERFEGLVVVDEAYIDFAPHGSMIPFLNRYPNLVIMQTFSKARAAAGIRLGMALASPDLIAVFDRIKAPYNLNTLTLEVGMEILSRGREKEIWIRTILQERKRLVDFLTGQPEVEKVFPSDANFILVRFRNAGKMKGWLERQGIIVRDRSGETGCEGCLRITVGSREENERLIKQIQRYEE
ncbi:MAG TPA: histidinol-phosphate transaminase [Bacteroidetes bacterium]|nr:histidinol-phosphate transaminase [Bacteroidota bacterium]